MKKFENKIKQIKRTRIIEIIITIIMAMILFIAAIIELLPREREYFEFNKNKKESEYVKATILYLTGPLLETTTSKENIKSQYYIAMGENKELLIIRTAENSGLPILGENVKEEEVDLLEGTEVLGSIQAMSASLRSTLVQKLNTAYNEELITDNGFIEVMGVYYIDMVTEEEPIAIELFLGGVCFAIVGCIYILYNRKIRKLVNDKIEEFKEKGILEDIIQEYEGGQLIEYKKLKVSISPKYVFSYNAGIMVISFNNIKEVYTSKRMKGDVDKNKYIIIKTKDEKEHYIAAMQKRKDKALFEEILAKIKRTIE